MNFWCRIGIHVWPQWSEIKPIRTERPDGREFTVGYWQHRTCPACGKFEKRNVWYLKYGEADYAMMTTRGLRDEEKGVD